MIPRRIASQVALCRLLFRDRRCRRPRRRVFELGFVCAIALRLAAAAYAGAVPVGESALPIETRIVGVSAIGEANRPVALSTETMYQAVGRASLSAAFMLGSVVLEHADTPPLFSLQPGIALGANGLLDTVGTATLAAGFGTAMLSASFTDDWDTRADTSTLIMLSTATAYLVKTVMKALVDRPRPYDPGERDSFPSGHTAVATAFAAANLITAAHGDADRTFAVITTVLAVTTGVLRIVAGYHYPSDVIAGAVVGTSIGVLLPTIVYRMRDQRP